MDDIAPERKGAVPAVSNVAFCESAAIVVQAGLITGGVHVHLRQEKPPVPRQLTAAPSCFVGRGGEFARLTAALDDAARPGGTTVLISALAGAGGIGKTALALHWSHHNLHRFPDGQLFVDLQGFSPVGAPLSPASVLRGFLVALGVEPGTIPGDLPTQTALYRSLVAGRQMLIVLDNAATSDQVEPLLPGSSACTVVVTSRSHLSGLLTRHGVDILRLGSLTSAEAVQLLTARLGRRVAAEPDAVDELLACCDGHPLALGIVASRACAMPTVPLAELAAELRDSATRVAALDDEEPAASLPSVLSWSLRSLSTEQVRVFGLLGIAPGPDISTEAAASLTALTPNRTRAILRGLEQASLVERREMGRYRMHDLTRGYAAANAPTWLSDVDCVEAVRRLVDFYLHTAYSGDKLIFPNRAPFELSVISDGCRPHPLTDGKAAMVWFAAEHPCLLAVLQYVLDQGWHTTVCQLARTLTAFQYRDGRLHDNLNTWRAGLTAAGYLADPGTLVLAHRRIGDANSRLRRYSAALEHLQQALTLANEIDDLRNQARVHYDLVHLWGEQGDNHKALEHSQRALRLFQALDAPVWEAASHGLVGWYSAKVNLLDQARISCETALAMFRRHVNRDGEALVLDSLGYVANNAGQHQKAVDYHQKAVALFREVGQAFYEADALNHLGDAYIALDSDDEAHATWQEALGLYKQQGRSEDVARMRRKLVGSQREE